ncbi:MAG TPA: LPS assembly protein LptD [Syntrophorhabdaceae bacterium]|nr:LPS assembly protein LptD [Syntrophorhabdaceae bacterium]
MNVLRIIIPAIFLLVPLLASASPADFRLTGPVDMTARYLEHNREDNTYIARGDVDLKEGMRSLKADYMVYNDTTKDVTAEGNVVFQEQGDRVECDRMQLNLETKKGTLENAKIYIKEGNFYVSGQNMEKVGESEYVMRRGEFTTCGWDKPAWKFTASDVDITVEGYAKTKSATFRILDYPVFYFPWGMFPVKTERQSGLLLPEVALSTRNGTMINTAYYWAISKDKDATFYLNYLENRGFAPGMQFRYALRDDIKGAWDYSIIQDKEYDGTRWQLRGKHEEKFFNDLELKADLRFISDKDYLADFGTSVQERAENQLKSTAYVEKPFEKSLLTTEMAYFRDLTQRNNDATYQYLPRTSFFTEYIPLAKGKLFTDFSSNFTTFYRDKGDTFSRLALEPSLRLPFSIYGLNLLASGTLIETAYLIDHSDTIDHDAVDRHTFRIEGDANMQFIRNFNTSLFNIGEMQSLIRPQVKYTFVPNTSFVNIPNIDPYDRIYQSNSITYSFNHYLYGLNQGAQRELALFELAQTYGLSGSLDPSPTYDGSGNRFSDIDARLTLYPTQRMSYTTQLDLGVNGEGIKTIRNVLSQTQPGKYYVNIWHSYTTDLTNEAFFDVGATYKQFEAGYQIRYSFMDQDWVDTLYKLRYRPGCWSTTIALTQTKRPRDTRINITFDLAGLTMR